MKGQIYLLIGILLALGLLMLRSSVSVMPEVSEPLINENFDNLKQEIVNTVDLSIVNNESIEDNLIDFINYSKSYMNRNGFEEDIQYKINSIDNLVDVDVDIYLSSQDSYLRDSIKIERRIYE